MHNSAKKELFCRRGIRNSVVLPSLYRAYSMKISILRLFGAVILIAASSLVLRAQVCENFAVVASATVQLSPNKVTITWLPDVLATGYAVSRRIYGGSDDFALLASSTGKDSTYVDTNITLGYRYEYQIIKTFKQNGVQFFGYGYLAVGVNAPLVDHMGGVIILTDSVISQPLKTELARLELDLIGDGWTVTSHVVGRSMKVTDIKAIVKKDYQVDPMHTRSLFIFGHVPIPYSGLLNPDGHSNHLGAWPTDLYYGNFDGDWTDNVINDDSTVLVRPEIRNVIGDGKFDQSSIPAPMNLEVGRVDLWDMPAFAKSDTELLRQYLNKDHAFRFQTLTAPARGLISDNFGAFTGLGEAEAFASDAWRAFPAFFGLQNTHVLSWFGTLDTAAYLCAYGCGGGWFTSADGVGNTTQFDTIGSKAIFTMLFGSYFGDWDYENSFLRAPLCTTYGLTSSWSGRPLWVFHAMAVGEPIGTSARMTEDSSARYVQWRYNNRWGNAANNDGGDASYVSAELLGDPTLKLFYPLPIADQHASLVGQKTVHLTWVPPKNDGDLVGFNLYSSAKRTGPFTKINPQPVSATSYDDIARYTDSNFYMVRSVKLITTASGSYYAASEGQVMQVNGVAGVETGVSQFVNTLTVKQSARGVIVTISNADVSSAHLAVYDLLGREVAVLHDGTISAGISTYGWDLRTVSGATANSGTYFVRMTGSGNERSAKFNVNR